MKMSLILKSLTLKDFLSHEDTTISFSENQKLLFDGDSGSGKSSLFEAIIWSLYGQGRSNNTSLVRRGAKKASVTLSLAEEEKNYEIERSVSQAGKHTLTVKINGTAHPETRLRELQEWIEGTLIGASYLLFVNSVAYLQSGVDTFVTQTAARRKELLLEIVKTGDFDEYYEKTRAKIGEKEVEHAALTSKLESLSVWVHNAEEKIKTKEHFLESLSLAKKEIVFFEKQRDELLVTLEQEKQAASLAAQAESLARQLAVSVDDAHRLYIASVDAGKTLESIAESEKEHDDLVHLLDKLDERFEQERARNEKKKQEPKVNDYSSMLNAFERQIKNAYSDEKCPAGKDCPHEEGLHQIVKDSTDGIKTLLLEKSAEEAAHAVWLIDYEALPDPKWTEDDSIKRTSLVSKKQQIDRLLAQKPTLAALVEQEASRETEFRAREAACKAARLKAKTLTDSLDPSRFSTLEGKKALLDGSLLEWRNKEAAASGELIAIEMFERQLPQVQKELVAFNRSIKHIEHDVSKLKLLKAAFGSTGIRSVVIDYLLPSLEDKINVILAQMSDFRVRLDTQQGKADGEGNKEGLFITIINEMGQEMDFNLYSGGEKLKLVVSISEALATLQKVGWRMFDETFIGLDPDSTESFVSVLDTLLSRYPQVLCISHLQQIKDSFEDRIIITKHNGVSIVTI